MTIDPAADPHQQPADPCCQRAANSAQTGSSDRAARDRQVAAAALRWVAERFEPGKEHWHVADILHLTAARVADGELEVPPGLQ